MAAIPADADPSTHAILSIHVYNDGDGVTVDLLMLDDDGDLHRAPLRPEACDELAEATERARRIARQI